MVRQARSGRYSWCRCGKIILVGDFLGDFLRVSQGIGDRRVDFGKGEALVFGENVLRRQTAVEPTIDRADRDTVSSDTSSSAARSKCLDDQFAAVHGNYYIVLQEHQQRRPRQALCYLSERKF